MNEAKMTFFFFFFFPYVLIFLGMLQPGLGKNGTQNFFFLSHFGLSRLGLARNEAKMRFLIFWLFFLNFVGIAPTRVKGKR